MNDKGAGNTVENASVLRISARALSRLPFERLEVVQNGVVVAEQSAISQREAKLEREVLASQGGWIAARVAGGSKTHAGYPVFAHTSPIYYRTLGTLSRQAAAAGEFVDEIEDSVRFIRKNYRFASDADQALALGRFEQGRIYYAGLVSQGA